jgi:hypothetical protein
LVSSVHARRSAASAGASPGPAILMTGVSMVDENISVRLSILAGPADVDGAATSERA